MTTPQDCSINLGAESTYKTYVAGTRAMEFNDESLVWEADKQQGTGMRVNARIPRSSRRVITKGAGSGDLTCDFLSKGMGVLLDAAVGSSTVTQISATIAYQHVFTLGDTPKSLSVQKTLPRTDGTLDSHTFLGCMVDSWELDSPNGEIVTLKTSFDIGDYTTAQGFGALTAPTGASVFHFGQASLKVGGTITAATTTALASSTGATTIGVRDFNLSVKNNLTGDRYNYNGNASGQGRKAKPTVGMREITGKLTAEYDSTTLRDAYLADTSVPLLLTFTGANIVGGNFDTLQISLPDVRLDSGVPVANNGDLITVEHTFTVLGADNQASSLPLQLVTVTTDTTL